MVFLKAQNSDLKAALNKLEVKVDDLENRAHRSNLRLVGLPESTEAGDVWLFGKVDP